MVTASRMQNMVQIRKNNVYFVTRNIVFVIVTFRALGVESPRGGAVEYVLPQIHLLISTKMPQIKIDRPLAAQGAIF